MLGGKIHHYTDMLILFKAEFTCRAMGLIQNELFMLYAKSTESLNSNKVEKAMLKR